MRITPRTRVGVIGLGVAISGLAVRSRLLCWGATGEESCALLPGDELIERADLTATRAITIPRAAEAVWPWVAQLGQGRGGFYSYDTLENLARCDIHSADRIVAEWQQVSVGDGVRLAPEVSLRVAAVQPGSALVLQGGVPMGSTPPPYEFTWAFVLREHHHGSTRLIVRERYQYTRGWARLLVEPVSLVSFVMTERMLRGIRDRATGEDDTVARGPADSPPNRLPDLV